MTDCNNATMTDINSATITDSNNATITDSNNSSSSDNQTVQALKSLNMGDLARAAGASQDLVSDCCHIFSEKFGNKTFQIPLKGESNNCLKLVFKHFGHLISKMLVNYGAINKKKEVSPKFVHRQIEKFCSESLRELEIIEISSDMEFVRKFPNLKTFMIDGGFISETVLRFDKWCPTLEIIEYNSVENISTTFNPQQTISSLKSFTLNHSMQFARSGDKKKTVSMTDLNSFIRFNPQLTELIVNVIEVMTRPEKRFKPSDDIPFENTVSVEPLTLKIMIAECPDGLKDLIVPFERVTHLDLNYVLDVLDEEALKFIGKCHNVKTLKMKITCDEFFSDDNWIAITGKLTKLTTLSCHLRRFFPVSNEDCEIIDLSLNGIRPFMIHCEHLSNINVHCENQFNYCDEDDFEGDECDNVIDDLIKFENELKNGMTAWSLAYEAQIIEDTSVSYKYTLTK